MITPRTRIVYGPRAALPTLAAMLVAILANLPYGIDIGTTVPPLLTLIVVFFWLSRRPNLLPPVVVFFIGLWHDLLVGAPVGLTSMLLLVVRAAVTEQNIIVFAQSFILGWVGFAALCLLVSLVEWLVVSWLASTLFSVGPFMQQVLLSILVYPPLAAICGWLDLRVLGIRKA